MEPRTNLKVLRRSRKRPERGDIFMFTPYDDLYLLGRVILADVPQANAPMPGSNLIYLYWHLHREMPHDLSHLRPSRLLMAPVWTNNLAWTKGYFQTLKNEPVSPFDLLQQHCFSRVALSKGATEKYVDEKGAILSHRFEPCGEWALASYRWIDDHVSDALGIPRVPVDTD